MHNEFEKSITSSHKFAKAYRVNRECSILHINVCADAGYDVEGGAA